LVVPALGVDASVQAFSLNPDRTMPAPASGSVVAWYTFSAFAGGWGNSVLAAHRDWGGRQGVFYHLGALRQGDVIWVQDSGGVWHRYAVVWSTSLREDRIDVQEATGPTVRPSLTLITCDGVFSSQVGAYLERRLVRAELVLPEDDVPPELLPAGEEAP
jgi:LPXTG-site transpeptidase (sortase) family protein